MGISTKVAIFAHPEPDVTLQEAQRVIALERDGLDQLIHTLDQSFLDVVNTILDLKGRVIVTGVGKSSHVGRKLVATLASTGTPSYFVHSGEASHGDLGMITPDDLVIAISNSGEAPELVHIINYVQRFSIPLISMTKNAHSSLAKASTHVLLLPDVDEACSLGMAPTTSTTMSMALGDALAICLLNRRSFSKSDFGILHPGGRLGQMLLKVEQIMHKSDELPLCQPDTLMDEAIVIMTSKRMGCVGVVDKKNQLIGMITDGDLRRHLAEGVLGKTADTIMTPNPSTLHADQLASEALGFLNARKITNIFVVERGSQKPIGLIHIHDLLKFGS